MSLRRPFVPLFVVFAAAAWTSVASASSDGDAGRGKSKFEAVCVECHEPKDVKGADAVRFADHVPKVASGAMKHRPKLKLTAVEAADVAAYIRSLK